VDQQVPFSGSGEDFAGVACPTGEVALAGGYASSPSHALVDTSDRGSPSSNGWLLSVQHDASTIVTVEVECLKDAPGATVTQRLKDVMAPAGALASGAASCNAGEVLVGGGFTGVSGPSGVEIYNFMASGGSQWGGYAFNHSAFAAPITFYAECLAYPGAHSNQTAVAQSSVPAGGAVTTRSHPCAGGTYVSGGGFADDEHATIYTMFVSDQGVQNGQPIAPDTTWGVQLQSAPGYSNLLNAYAMCLSFS
jgi:hypothetical protein